MKITAIQGDITKLKVDMANDTLASLYLWRIKDGGLTVQSATSKCKNCTLEKSEEQK